MHGKASMREKVFERLEKRRPVLSVSLKEMH